MEDFAVSLSRWGKRAECVGEGKMAGEARGVRVCQASGRTVGDVLNGRNSFWILLALLDTFALVWRPSMPAVLLLLTVCDMLSLHLRNDSCEANKGTRLLRPSACGVEWPRKLLRADDAWFMPNLRTGAANRRIFGSARDKRCLELIVAAAALVKFWMPEPTRDISCLAADRLLERSSDEKSSS